MTKALIATIIFTNLERRGNGKDDPVRILVQGWTCDGALLFELDPTKPEQAEMHRRCTALMASPRQFAVVT